MEKKMNDHDPTAMVSELLGQLHDVRCELAELKDTERAIRDRIARELPRVPGWQDGEPLRFLLGIITRVPSYRKVSYKARELDGLLAANPALAALLHGMRVETWVEESFRVKFAGPGADEGEDPE